LLVDGVVGPKTWKLLCQPALPLQSDRFEFSKYEKIADESARGRDARKVLLYAVQDIGKREAPSGSNQGKEISHLVEGYNEHWKINSESYPPWCAIAVSSWMRLGLGLSTWDQIPFGNWFGAVAQITAWAKKRKQFFKADQIEIKGGDIVTLPRGGSSSDVSSSGRAGHTGLVLKNEGDRLLTIEGNVSNKVKVCSRPLKMLSGIVVWSDDE
ncbi:MAG TPA: CHAP domain-containing protein, partial [Chromatiaceae bacterium]|nr:CHAP domain-containing protein [Chromatiaceae bacterium]